MTTTTDDGTERLRDRLVARLHREHPLGPGSRARLRSSDPSIAGATVVVLAVLGRGPEDGFVVEIEPAWLDARPGVDDPGEFLAVEEMLVPVPPGPAAGRPGPVVR